MDLDKDFEYKKYSLQQLDNWVNDALNCDDLTAQQVYDTIVKCVAESVEYHDRYLNKSNELLSLLKNPKSEKERTREYNLREAEYYNKRAQLDADYEAIKNAGGYEYTPLP